MCQEKEANCLESRKVLWIWLVERMAWVFLTNHSPILNWKLLSTLPFVWSKKYMVPWKPSINFDDPPLFGCRKGNDFLPVCTSPSPSNKWWEESWELVLVWSVYPFIIYLSFIRGRRKQEESHHFLCNPKIFWLALPLPSNTWQVTYYG